MAPMAHSPSRALDVGAVIAETYTIEGMIGRGGMGAVFVASHARLPGKKVAIKVLHPDVADPESLARFRREAEIASRLGHPNIVEVHDWNQLPDGTPYLVLELLQGESLADRLKQGPMTVEEVYPLIRQVGSALTAAHKEGIVHRDLKPANIFLVPGDDNSVRAKVLDFGISKIRGSTTVMTQDTQMLGTPQYMAPEQAMGRHDEVDGRTDVFALGAVVFEMLAGFPAFGGSTIPEVVFKVVYEPAPSLLEAAPGTPPHVAAAVDRALAKKSIERWDDVGQFVEALTGSPLLSGRRSISSAARVGAPSPSKPSTAARPAEDAFAATVGSGDHGSAMMSQAREALRAGPGAVGTTASATPVVAAATQAAPVVLAPTKPGRPLLIALAVVLVGGAVALGFVLAGGTKKDAAGPTATAAAIDAAGAAPIDATQVAVADLPGADAGAGVDAGAALDGGAIAAVDAGAAVDLVDAGVRKPNPTPKPIDAGAAGATESGDDGDDDPGDPELRQLLTQARAALASGDSDLALQLSRRALNKFPGTQAASALRAQAYCAQDDLGGAKRELQHVKKPRLRQAIKRACRARNIEL